jgi:hypothetical protein
MSLNEYGNGFLHPFDGSDFMRSLTILHESFMGIGYLSVRYDFQLLKDFVMMLLLQIFSP